MPESLRTDYRPILCVDFDGVVHSYERGWQGGELYGKVVPGFFEWVERVERSFKILIYSSRSQDRVMRVKMQNWLDERELEWRRETGRPEYPLFRLEAVADKPKAFLTIDDRCVRFDGDWGAEDLKLHKLVAFKPWTQP